MSTTHLCLKTYHVCDRLGEIRPIVVKAYVVPGLKHDLLSVKGLNQSGYSNPGMSWPYGHGVGLTIV